MREGAPRRWSPCGQGGVSVCCGPSSANCVSRGSKSLRETLCIVMLQSVRCPVVKGHKMLGLCPMPTAVLVHQRPCLSLSSSASIICGGGRWRPGVRVCFAFSLCCRAGVRSAGVPVVCVCLASASLNKQRLGWTLLPSVCNGTGGGGGDASEGEGDLVKQKGRYPTPSVTADLAERAARS